MAPHLRIRLDAELLARVEKSRQANNRTLTGEIAHRLEESFRRENLRQVIEDTAKVAAAATLREAAGRLLDGVEYSEFPKTSQTERSAA